jgi:hypothetical protein
MGSTDKNRSLLESTVELLRSELSEDNKDAFTRSYLEKRLAEVSSYLDSATGKVRKEQLKSAKNIVSNISNAIDQNASYDNPSAQFYKAAVGDLKDELEAACDD